MPTPTAQKKAHFKKYPLTLAIQACCYTILGGTPLAVAVPTGGEVVGGSGTISQSGTSTTINQATQNLAINWQTFDVAANERVQFIQPNSNSVALKLGDFSIDVVRLQLRLDLPEATSTTAPTRRCCNSIRPTSLN